MFLRKGCIPNPLDKLPNILLSSLSIRDDLLFKLSWTKQKGIATRDGLKTSAIVMLFFYVNKLQILQTTLSKILTINLKFNSPLFIPI